MLLSLSAVFWAALLAVLLHSFQKWNASRKYRTAAIKHGCMPPATYPHKDPLWGYDLVKERVTAAGNGNQLSLYMEHFSLYGKTFEEKSMGNKVINTMEARNIQHVAALGFDDYGKPSNALFGKFLGNGIFSRDGPVWKHSRNMVKPIFSHSEIAVVDALGVHLDSLIEFIPRDGTTIDLQLPVNKMFINASAEFLFGETMDTLVHGDGNSSEEEFLQAFQASLVGLGKRRLLGPLRHIYDLYDNSWQKSVDKVHAYVDVHVNRALEATHDPNDKQSHRYILLHELAKQIRDPVELRFQVLNILTPARDTTALLVNSAIFYLARKPEIWEQLRAESLAVGGQKLTLDRLRSLQLFKYVIYETLRLQGPSTRVQRAAIRDTILPTGGGPNGKTPVFVEKGTYVAMNLWGLHHDRDIWGEDAYEFRPERWVNKRPMWDFVPFLGGPRICPAQQQVLTHSIHALSRLTREFSRIENRDPEERYIEYWRLLPESLNGIKVALIP